MRILCDVPNFIPPTSTGAGFKFKFETIIMVSVTIREKFPPSLRDFLVQVSLVEDASLLTSVNDILH